MPSVYQRRGLRKGGKKNAHKFVFDDDKKEFMGSYQDFLKLTLHFRDSLFHDIIVSEIVDSKADD